MNFNINVKISSVFSLNLPSSLLNVKSVLKAPVFFTVMLFLTVSPATVFSNVISRMSTSI